MIFASVDQSSNLQNFLTTAYDVFLSMEHEKSPLESIARAYHYSSGDAARLWGSLNGSEIKLANQWHSIYFVKTIKYYLLDELCGKGHVIKEVLN